MFEQWRTSDDGREALGVVQAKAFKMEQANVSDAIARGMKSYYRRHLKHAWGSKEWLHTVIALGQIPAAFVAIMQRLCDEKAALAPAQGNPRQLPRADRGGIEAGIQHQVSYAKRLREEAKYLDKKIKAQQDMWEGNSTGRRMLSWWDWNKLLADREQAWDMAEIESYKSGFPFNDRDGVRRNAEPRDLVGRALPEYCQTIGVEYK